MDGGTVARLFYTCICYSLRTFTSLSRLQAHQRSDARLPTPSRAQTVENHGRSALAKLGHVLAKSGAMNVNRWSIAP
jgi:hypothetical protein